jgi:carbon storage regulator
MLVISRKLFEKLFIGPDIVVTVVRIDGNKIRLGIEAPASVKVWREELMAKYASKQPRAQDIIAPVEPKTLDGTM